MTGHYCEKCEIMEHLQYVERVEGRRKAYNAGHDAGDSDVLGSALHIAAAAAARLHKAATHHV